MQQTTKYKLNLIEPTDPFLPDGLNANTQKVEDALAAHEAAVGEVTDGLDARVTVLEGHKVAVGTFQGTADSRAPQTEQIPQFIPIGFTPRLGFVHFTPSGSYGVYVWTEADTDIIYPAEGGFYVKKHLNYSGYVCHYIMFS